MNVPSDIRYTKEHEWVKIDGDIATIGITDWAQSELGDIVFVELPQVGDAIEQAGAFGTIEAVKAVSELYSPLSGTVAEINASLDDDPTVVNRDPFGDGWMIKMTLTDSAQLEQLLSADGYKEIIAD